MQIQPICFSRGAARRRLSSTRTGRARVNLVMPLQGFVRSRRLGVWAEMLEKVMHGSLLIGDSTVLVSDGHAREGQFRGVFAESAGGGRRGGAAAV